MFTIFASELKNKLSLLKRQRQQEKQRSLWRAFIVSSLTGGLLWLAIFPQWQITQKAQVQISGEHLIKEEKIFTLLDLSLPQFIWTIPPEKLSQQLESIPAIATAKVKRQIFPCKLTISIAERTPVALVLSAGQVGFLDAKGIMIPSNFYELNEQFPFPKIKVINWQPEYRLYWLQIYNLLTYYSQIKIWEIRWQESNNLVLKTEIGTVYLGSPADRLKDKFAVLAKLKNLPEYLKTSQIAYIDLSNPDVRLIQRYSQ
jgi:cell division protein FtsQ